jgi:hypothetical protein
MSTRDLVFYLVGLSAGILVTLVTLYLSGHIA